MPAPASQVLDDLRQQLHQANEHFHESRSEWEHWLAAHEFRHDERIDQAREKLREAEAAVEAIEKKIKRALEGEAAAPEAPAAPAPAPASTGS